VCFLGEKQTNNTRLWLFPILIPYIDIKYTYIYIYIYMVFRYKKNGELVLRRAVVSQRVEAAACVS